MPVKGRLTTVSTQESREFMFNPEEIRREKQTFISLTPIAGGSHPIHQFGAGGADTFTFDIKLDGDRGRFGRRDQQTTLDINNEIDWYRSLLYPEEFSGGSFSGVHPQKVLFSFGNYVNSLPCVVLKADPTVTYFTPNLEPVRATVSLTLSVSPPRSQTAPEVRILLDLF